MMIEKNALREFPDSDPSEFKLEAETHTTRVKTLQHLKRQREKISSLIYGYTTLFLEKRNQHDSRNFLLST